MRILNQITADLRYAIGLAGYIRRKVEVEDARVEVEKQLAHRSGTFLQLIQDAVYANPHSPYLKLLQHAGIEFGDIGRGVLENGLEPTLETLYEAGVYVTPEEIKGRRPIQRKGIEFPVAATDFDNPVLKAPQIYSRTSGSTGEPTRVRVSFDTMEYRNLESVLAYAAWSDLAQGRPHTAWSTGGPTAGLRYAKEDLPLEKLFIARRGSPYSLRQRILFEYSRWVAKRLGRKIPAPEVVTRDEPEKIAHWLAEMTAKGTPALMRCHPNPAVRICLAAKERGLDISGTLFRCGGEPYTPAKDAVLRSAGARAVVGYSMNDTGMVGMPCSHTTELDDVHFCSDRLALIQRDRELGDKTVGALIYTSLHPQTSKILLNAESGDYATVTTRDCACLLGQMGFNTHLHTIRSYEKLTSEGATFIGSRLLELVEEVLPARFGGSMTDYQIVEEEQPDSLSRVSIVISPRVGGVDESDVLTTVMGYLQRSHAGAEAAVMLDEWRQSQTLQVIRREPHETRSMKVHPLRVVRASDTAVTASSDR